MQKEAATQCEGCNHFGNIWKEKKETRENKCEVI